jgi:hypothetical protein
MTLRTISEQMTRVLAPHHPIPGVTAHIHDDSSFSSQSQELQNQELQSHEPDPKPRTKESRLKPETTRKVITPIPIGTANIVEHDLPSCWKDVNDALAAGIDRLILFGPPGTGKTFGGLNLGDVTGGAFRLICNEDMTAADVTGHFMPTADGTWKWLDGAVLKAWQGNGQTGGRIVADEIDRASGDVLSLLLNMFDSPESASWQHPDSGQVFTPRKNFSVVMTTTIEDMRDLPVALQSALIGLIQVHLLNCRHTFVHQLPQQSMPTKLGDSACVHSWPSISSASRAWTLNEQHSWYSAITPETFLMRFVLMASPKLRLQSQSRRHHDGQFHSSPKQKSTSRRRKAHCHARMAVTRRPHGRTLDSR